MTKDINYYRRKFSLLNVSKSAGVAPNQPVLLLSVIELIQRGQIQHNRIYLSLELIATFLKFWKDLYIKRKADIIMPSFAQKRAELFYFKANPGFEFIESSKCKIKIRSIKDFQQAVNYIYLDCELFSLLNDPTFSNDLTFVLIDTWFSDQAQQLQQSLSIDDFAERSAKLLSKGGKVYQRQEVEKENKQEAIAIVRDGAFRRVVTLVYDYRCAFCGLQVFNNMENIVDGAHIKPFSLFYDDRIDNGISLCKNHHWAFDRFWFTIKEDYTIQVADNLHEDSPHATPMKSFQGRQILLPNHERHYPRRDALGWHRQAFEEKVS